jgi:hypothetical protein
MQPWQPNSRRQGEGMARRATEGSVKSPVNIVVGMLLKRLRERSDKQLDQVAPAFDVSPAYLAAIEAGTNAVPAKSVAGLGILGLDFVAASAILSLVSYLDCRMKNSRIYDFREVRYRAERLLSQTGALALKPFLKWTVATIRSADRGASLDIQRGLEALGATLQQLSQLKPPADATPDKALPLSLRLRLSPMVEDLLDIASSGLSLLTPHINRFNFKAWEELNADRMVEVRGYVNDAERFLADAPDFDWHAILLNSHRPPLTILVPGRTPLSELEIADTFYDQLPRYSRRQSHIEDVKRQIRFGKVSSKPIENQIKRALVYDFSQGQIIQEESWSALGVKVLNQKRFSQFDNAWLYKLSGHHGPDPASRNLVGILGAYDNDDVSSFGVFLDREDTNTWWTITTVIN